MISRMKRRVRPQLEDSVGGAPRRHKRVVTVLLFALVGAALVACGGAAPTPSLGSTYEDPEHAYTIQVDPAWEIQVGGFAQGVEVWFIGPPENGFRPNVNLLTQAAPGVSLADYTAASIRSAPNLMSDFKLVSQVPVGADLELLEYTGTASGHFLHFLALFGVHADHAVIATLTAPDESFAALRAKVEPLLRTLRLT